MPTSKSLDDVIIFNQTRIVKKTIFLQTFIPEIGKSFISFYDKTKNLSPYKSSKFHWNVGQHKVKEYQFS